jgi:hypothetical protein
MYSKKGEGRNVAGFVIVGLLLLVFLFFIVYLTITYSKLAVNETLKWNEVIGENPIATLMTYIFGDVTMPSDVNTISATIITVAVWLLLFVTFGDIVATFSTFTPYVSWIIAFLISVIAANLGFVVKFVGAMTAIFSILGALSIYLGLGAAFVAFVVVNLGIWSLRGWVLKRRAMMSAATMEAGGEKLKGTIEGLGKAGEGLESIGRRR